jgi:hypothetical protein
MPSQLRMEQSGSVRTDQTVIRHPARHRVDIPADVFMPNVSQLFGDEVLFDRHSIGREIIDRFNRKAHTSYLSASG